MNRALPPSSTGPSTVAPPPERPRVVRGHEPGPVGGDRDDGCTDPRGRHDDAARLPAEPRHRADGPGLDTEASPVAPDAGIGHDGLGAAGGPRTVGRDPAETGECQQDPDRRRQAAAVGTCRRRQGLLDQRPASIMVGTLT
ncbi:hypothetical protein [Nocardioides sp. B-3]|uniref:hypothetical protein n=1 Tax=Nocardioides sp. B-3 TaxID=2895565 RepID=UPI0021539F5D|nr:hypothetical protein [Nocardioides sp. B-3]UUZ59180.1 hypothetical protein LP418_25195 [Nocardioides sp. B-3]